MYMYSITNQRRLQAKHYYNITSELVILGITHSTVANCIHHVLAQCSILCSEDHVVL